MIATSAPNCVRLVANLQLVNLVVNLVAISVANLVAILVISLVANLVATRNQSDACYATRSVRNFK